MVSSSPEIDEVDRLPKPRRPKLAIATLWPYIHTAVEQAWRGPIDRRHAEFYRLMADVVPVAGRTETLDDWARLGVFEGAMAGWEGRPPQPAKDTTSIAEAQTYMASVSAACILTLAAISAVRHG